MLDWKGNEEFFNAPNNVWKENDEVVGMHKTGGNLTFIVVNKAGHMVPKD
jgi:carboxypeptidase C (cathepsin A)